MLTWHIISAVRFGPSVDSAPHIAENQAKALRPP